MDISHLQRAFQLPLNQGEFRELDIYIRKTADEARFMSPAPRESAVLILLHLIENKPHLLLIKRPIYAGVHSGQMAFPGGKREQSDKSLLDTAIREVHEELGILIELHNSFFALRELYIPPSHFLVQPYICFLNQLPPVKPNHEVAHIIQLPVEHLLQKEIITQHEIEIFPTKELRTVPAIAFDNHYIWGATAMMLYEIRTRLLSIREPNESSIVPPKKEILK
jgi:8-oxo-dGTP pyrophosphatase MutT (NUDIX family)